MEHTSSIPDLPSDIYPHILRNLDIWNFVNARSVCKEFKKIVDKHLSLQKNLNFTCELYGGAGVCMSNHDSYHSYVYYKTDIGCEADCWMENETSGDATEIEKTFQGKDPSEIGIEHFGIVARNPVVRLDECFLLLDAEREEIFFKGIFQRMDHKLHTKNLEFYATPLSIIRRVLGHVEAGFLQQIWICDSPMGEEAKEVAKEIAKMDHWKLAKELMVDGWNDLSSFPVDVVLHTRKFKIDLKEITVEDLVRVKEKLFSSPIFEEGMIRHYEGLTIDDFTEGKEYINSYVKSKTKSNIPIPWELVVVILSTVIVSGAGLRSQTQVVEEIPVGVPEITVPAFWLIPKILPDALSITLVNISVWLSVSKMLAHKMDYEVDSGQDGGVAPSDGLQSEPCVICPQGPQGLGGAPGAKRPQGPRGSPGLSGVDGRRGEPGMSGPAGTQGEPGPQGPPGKKGDDGRVINVNGPPGPPGAGGPQGRKGERGPKGVPGSVHPGVQGLTGDQGRKGRAGRKGETGGQGPIGSKGPNGDCFHCPTPRTPPGYQFRILLVSFQ
ncbi:unnamed protein product [Caenorhabditis brenneri]